MVPVLMASSSICVQQQTASVLSLLVGQGFVGQQHACNTIIITLHIRSHSHTRDHSIFYITHNLGDDQNCCALITSVTSTLRFGIPLGIAAELVTMPLDQVHLVQPEFLHRTH